MADSESGSVAKSWDTYWSGAHDSAALTAGGIDNPTIQSFWSDYFGSFRDQTPMPAILDIASGNGAVIRSAQDVFGDRFNNFSCLDVSGPAIEMIRQRFPGVTGIVADAAKVPLPDASFGMITSQFGIEYADDAAYAEAVRLLAQAGQLAFLLHYHGGSIYKECSASVAALQDFAQSRYLPNCTAMFRAGFALRDGADPTAYQQAGREFAPSLRAMEAVMQKHGRDVAHGTLVRLYRDVRTIHQRMQHYDATEVLEWLDRMAGEIEEYAGRMRSMCEAALDQDGFAALKRLIEEQGLKILRAGPMVEAAGNQPLAWVLVAEKS